MYLGIAKKMEPLLLVPIGFGILLINLPLGGLMDYELQITNTTGAPAKVISIEVDETSRIPKPIGTKRRGSIFLEIPK